MAISARQEQSIEKARELIRSAARDVGEARSLLEGDELGELDGGELTKAYEALRSALYRVQR